VANGTVRACGRQFAAAVCTSPVVYVPDSRFAGRCEVGHVIASASDAGSSLYGMADAGAYVDHHSPQTDPVSASSLLLVIGEPWTNQHRHLIIERLTKGRY